MTAHKVLVTSRSFSSGTRDLIHELTAAGAQVTHGPADHAFPAIKAELASAVAWIAGTGPITRTHLNAAPQLRLVARYGVGTDSIDLAAAAEHGVTVTNTPGANTEAVADHALALTLALLRNVVVADRDSRSGAWRPHPAREVAGLRVGVAGFGRIGRAFAHRLTALGATVLAHDPNVPDDEMARNTVTPADLSQLAHDCDVVSLHAPGETLVVDTAWLHHGHAGLLLVNTARASLVDEQAVVTALRLGRLAGYAADDLAGGEAPAGHPLRADDIGDRVVITPHCAAQTVEAIDRMGATATAAVLAVLRGHSPSNIVALATDQTRVRQ
ncbi:MAG TPA: NAD(P)-dependent oxidoreductase [Jatrophihabitantaceae bacterium]|jgi:D-3-phosphoglycerate dehydrogenase|nr:NAD(P)-dependent oxidoreductase [Jatrophihabitantaceae bacterium]